MDPKKSQRGEIGRGEEGEERKLTILVIFMLTTVLVLYGVIPFI